MDDVLRELKDRITQMSDGELLRIIGPDRNDYRHEAIAYAQDELRIRHIPFDADDDNATVSADDEVDEAADAPIAARVTPPCTACGRMTRRASLYADKELTLYFPDTEEERFVEVIVCSSCGEIRLVADLNTDVED